MPSPCAAGPPESGKMASALMANEWRTFSQLAGMSYNEQKAAVIEELSARCTLDSKVINDDGLVDLAFLYAWLTVSNTCKEKQLRKMTPDDMRNSAIAQLSRDLLLKKDQLQAMSNKELTQLGYSRLLKQRFALEVGSLENIGPAAPSYHLHDDQGSLMDVLKVMPSGKDYAYLGFYHTQVDHNEFQLKMAGSDDLRDWVFVRSLGDFDHQADIAGLNDGYVLVNETDRTPEGNNLRIRYFATYDSLCCGSSSMDATLPHSFETPAEGTPSIREIEGSEQDDHTLLIGFHYFNTATGADELAFGTLKDLNPATWRVWRDDLATGNIRSMGYNGNIGTRSGFYEDELTLQEAQVGIGDWSSWDILLGNNYFYINLELNTPGGSQSFANPKISPSIEKRKFIVTYFLPMHGNVLSEIGTLLYIPEF